MPEVTCIKFCEFFRKVKITRNNPWQRNVQQILLWSSCKTWRWRIIYSPKRRFVRETLPIRQKMLAEIKLESWGRNNGRVVIEDGKTDNFKFSLFALYPSPPKKDIGLSSFPKTLWLYQCADPTSEEEGSNVMQLARWGTPSPNSYIALRDWISWRTGFH